MQIAAVGFGTGSVQPLALQFTPPIAHPQELPAPSVVREHDGCDTNGYEGHA